MGLILLCVFMRSFNVVLANHASKSALISGVINCIGITNVLPVLSLGAGAGFPKFVYDHDKTRFYKRHSKSINKWIAEIAYMKGFDAATYVHTLISEQAQLLGVSETPKSEISNLLLGTDAPYPLHEPTEIFMSLWAVTEVCRLFISSDI